MGVTTIGWTGTPLTHPLSLARELRLDEKANLHAGEHPVGEILPGFTFNPWVGCQRVSEACRRCYAEAWSKRAGYSPDGRHHLTIWGPPSTTPRVRTSRENWRRPRRWNQLAGELGVRFKVFCASLADVGEDHPMVAPWREELFDLIDATPHLDWLLLTKRPEHLGSTWRWKTAPRNVWAGATMEDQDCADERADALISIPAAVHFASVEPMLSRINLDPARCPYCGEFGEVNDHGGTPWCVRCDSEAEFGHWLNGCAEDGRIAWVILGGESGPGHRALDLLAAEDLAMQCRFADVALFVKQDSGPHPGTRGRLSDAMWSLKQWPEVRHG